MITHVSERALRAAEECASALGLRFSRPLVLRDSCNLIVWLEPLPVVARVSTVTATVRNGRDWLAREVAVASFLAAAGMPVVAPSELVDAGPHEWNGFTLTFWELADEVGGPLDAERAGRALRACHEALESFDGELELPRFGGLVEALSILERLSDMGTLSDDDARALREAGSDAFARVEALELPMQPVHGDAHFGNVVNTAPGPLWNDWEDAQLAPRAWGLGCLYAHGRVLGRDDDPILRAQRGYGSELGEEVLEAFVDARRFQVTVWSVVMWRAGHTPAELVEERLSGYR
jgi:phosphotransferase family enzyme